MPERLRVNGNAELDIFRLADRSSGPDCARERCSARDTALLPRGRARDNGKRLDGLVGEMSDWQRETQMKPAGMQWWLFERDRLQALQAQVTQKWRLCRAGDARIERKQRRFVEQPNGTPGAGAGRSSEPPPV